MNNNVIFQTWEFQKEDLFIKIEYKFEKKEKNKKYSWNIFRKPIIPTLKEKEKEFQLVENLGKGFVLVNVKYCGICKTDISRKFLPFKLPQIIGHEVVGYTIDKNNKRRVAIEINASHYSRGLSKITNCRYCCEEAIKKDPYLHIHCPKRLTLGIDRLPGGFSPYILVPINSLVDIPKSINMKIACLVEPFAAALHAVEITPPKKDDIVAVLGPKKLGLMIVVILNIWRKKYNLSFTIVSISRHDELKDILIELGSNSFINITKEKINDHCFDIVFDTTGTSDGFETALRLTKKILHYKSTSGNIINGIKYFTQMVVNEISLSIFNQENLDFSLPEEEKRENINIFISPSVNLEEIILKNSSLRRNFHQLSFIEAYKILKSNENSYLTKGSLLPKFDIAIISSIQEIDNIIKPNENDNFSLVREKGIILLISKESDFLTSSIMKKNISIYTTRCGNLHKSMKLLEENIEIAKKLKEYMITKIFPLDQINDAFQIIKNNSHFIKESINKNSLK